MSDFEKTAQEQKVNLSAKPQSPFIDSYLGPVVMGAVLVIILLGGALNNDFFHPTNLLNVFRQFVTYAAIAYGVVLTTRAKGPDFSLGPVMALSGIILVQFANNDNLIGGLLIVLAVCAMIGLINGTLTVYLRIPAIAVTVIMSVIVRIISAVISKGYPMNLQQLHHMDLTIAAVLMLAVCFAASFMLIYFSKLGIPLRKRDSKPKPINKYIIATIVYIIVQPRFFSSPGVSMTKILFCVVLIVLFLTGRNKSDHVRDNRPVSYVLAYIISSVMGALAGFYMVLRIQAAHPSIGSDNDLFILFVFVCAYSTKLVDNRFMPAVYALVPTCVWACLANLLNLNSVNTFDQLLFFMGMMLLFLGIAHVVNRKRGQGQLAGKSQNM